MRRRLYWLLPDVESARRTADDLLLARIEDRHMHFLARRGTDLRALHEASVLQKTDVRHAAGRGLFLGALIGALAAWLMTEYPIAGLEFRQGGVLIVIFFGALFGVFSAPLIFIPFLPRRLQSGAQIANERPVSVVSAPTSLLNQELDSRFLFSESCQGEFGTVSRGHHFVPPSSSRL